MCRNFQTKDGFESSLFQYLHGCHIFIDRIAIIIYCIDSLFHSINTSKSLSFPIHVTNESDGYKSIIVLKVI